MSRLYLPSIAIVSMCIFGCSSDGKKLESLCAEVKTASQMTHDCNEMANYLAPRTEEFQRIIARLNDNVPEESERIQYVDVVSQCLRGYLEISTGTCGKDERVRQALPKDYK